MSDLSAEKVVADHERIWLQNATDGEASGEGRLWCQDKVWPVGPGDGEPTEYVRADIHQKALDLIAHQTARLEEVTRERDEARLYSEAAEAAPPPQESGR